MHLRATSCIFIFMHFIPVWKILAAAATECCCAVINSVAAQRVAADKLAMKMLLLEAKARASYGRENKEMLKRWSKYGHQKDITKFI